MVNLETESANENSNEFSLAELSSAVTELLGRHGLLGGQSDHRVSAAPDARTIRYYTTLGLLDRPIISNRQAKYSRRHVLQLLAIKALQGISLPLGEIQARLYGRSDQELEAILAAVADRVAAREAVRPVEVRIVNWREVTIEPGLKVVAEAGWSPGADQAALMERIRAALVALSTASDNGADGGKER